MALQVILRNDGIITQGVEGSRSTGNKRLTSHIMMKSPPSQAIVMEFKS